jgi:hypothetical protein
MMITTALMLCMAAPADVTLERITEPRVIIAHDHPELAGNQYGFEGGSSVKVNNTHHLFMAEMYGDPFWVSMRLAHWSCDDGEKWIRRSTVVQSAGKGHEDDLQFSIWSPMAVYNEAEGRWNIFFVAYSGPRKEGDGTHMYGNIRRLVSDAAGMDGIAGPYHDAGILMKPDAESMPWEGQQGVDSFYPYKVGDRWYSNYGSHNYNPTGPWLVGLASAPALTGPWTRVKEHSPLPIEDEFIENPIMTQVDGVYITVYDSTIIEPGCKYVEDPNAIGYAWSADGIHWNKGKRLDVHPRAGENWAADIRTPLGLIPLGGDQYRIYYTAHGLGRQFWCVAFVDVRLTITR